MHGGTGVVKSSNQVESACAVILATPPSVLAYTSNIIRHAHALSFAMTSRVLSRGARNPMFGRLYTTAQN